MSASGQDELTPFRPSGQFSFAPRPEALAYQEHNYTLERVIRVLRKNFFFALLLACGITGIVLLYAVLQKDYYKPTARLDIAPPGSGIKTVHEIEAPSEADNLDYLETQVQILGSDALAVTVIRELRLDQSPEFAGPPQVKGPFAAKNMGVASPAVPSELAILQEQLDLANLAPAESLALENFRRNLSVASVRNTRLIEISFSSHDSQLAQQITNTLVTKFIEQNYKHRYTTTMQASGWLSSQLSDLRRKVEESGQLVADYQKKYGLVEVDDRDVPMSQLMNEVNRQLSDAQASRIEAEAFVRMIDEGHGEAVPALRDDKLYQDLMAHYSDLRTQLAQTRTVYGDANTNVQKLQDQIAEVSLQIDSERSRASSRTRSSYSAAVDREKLMVQERDKLRADMGYMSSQLASYHLLKNEANANAQLYNTLQTRLQEAGIYAGLGSSNIRVVDLAMNLRKATGPHRFLISSFGAIFSCIFAVLLSLARESFRNTVRTPNDVKFWTGLPSLALLPAMDKATQGGTSPLGTGRKFSNRWQMSKETGEHAGISIMKSLTAESESMRDLRTSLLRAKQGKAPRVILISSPMEGEGKTTVAVNLALALAHLGKTCLLDADLRQPSVAQAFKIQAKSGLADHLKKSSSLIATLVYLPEHENLAILPSGNVSQNPADLLSSLEMENLLDTLKKFFDYIVVDSPPVIPFSDARFLASLADEVVLVGRYEVTTRRAMQRTTELLREVNAPVAGVVLNGVDLSSPDYNYYTHGYRRWRSKGREESLLNSMGPNGSGNGGSTGAMSAHA
jgi:succinoglycan biosynthesis transport protein ExoP